MESSLAEMDDSNINRELKQKLNFSCCEKENEDEEQKEAQEGCEAQALTPEQSKLEDSEAMSTPPRIPLSTPPRTPLKDEYKLRTFQGKGRVTPEPVLGTLVSEPPKWPTTPAQPDDRSKLLYCESPVTPKVSKFWGEGPRFFQFSY